MADPRYDVTIEVADGFEGREDVAALQALIEQALADGPVTRDLGGQATTVEAGKAIAEAVRTA